jgi:hypothetical protein
MRSNPGEKVAFSRDSFPCRPHLTSRATRPIARLSERNAAPGGSKMPSNHQHRSFSHEELTPPRHRISRHMSTVAGRVDIPSHFHEPPKKRPTVSCRNGSCPERMPVRANPWRPTIIFVVAANMYHCVRDLFDSSVQNLASHSHFRSEISSLCSLIREKDRYPTSFERA